VSTRVTPDEYATLKIVPEENWGYRWGTKNDVKYTRLNLGACDVEPSHGQGTTYMQTPDHRGIVLCEGCYQEVMDGQLH